jgi:glycosyltransferase involved in cell wall biosynthesis
VVDDGSEPPFLSQSNLAPAARIDILRLPHNVGIEGALAAGVDALLTEGVDYIARIDAGDLALPERLSRQRRFLDAHPRVGALGMAARVVRRGESAAADHPGGDSSGYLLSPPTQPEAIRRLRFARSCFIHPAMMLRADAVKRAGNYRADYPAAEDLDLFLRIMQQDDCANLPEAGIVYELNEGGISGTRRRRQVLSTLKLQCRHFEPGNPFYWLGMAKNLAHLVVPYALLQRIKQGIFR